MHQNLQLQMRADMSRSGVFYTEYRCNFYFISAEHLRVRVKAGDLQALVCVGAGDTWHPGTMFALFHLMRRIMLGSHGHLKRQGADNLKQCASRI